MLRAAPWQSTQLDYIECDSTIIRRVMPITKTSAVVNKALSIAWLPLCLSDSIYRRCQVGKHTWRWQCREAVRFVPREAYDTYAVVQQGNRYCDVSDASWANTRPCFGRGGARKPDVPDFMV